MGYDRGDSFPFNFEPNGIPFGSKSKGKLSPRSYPIQCERKWKHSFLSVRIHKVHRRFFPRNKSSKVGAIVLNKSYVKTVAWILRLRPNPAAFCLYQTVKKLQRQELLQKIAKITKND